MGFFGKLVDGLKNLGKVADAATEVGSAIPGIAGVVGPIDAAKDAIKSVATGKKTKPQMVEAAKAAADALDAAKTGALQLGEKGRLSRTRLKTAIGAGLAVVLIYYGFPEEVADQIALYVVGLAGGYLGMETFRPSKT